MNTSMQRAVAALFPPGAEGVADIKFFPGTKAGATAEDFAAEMLKADAQIRNGLAVRSVDLDSDLTVIED
jgi:hypothetical protein